MNQTPTGRLLDLGPGTACCIELLIRQAKVFDVFGEQDVPPFACVTGSHPQFGDLGQLALQLPLHGFGGRSGGPGQVEISFEPLDSDQHFGGRESAFRVVRLRHQR